MPRALHHPEKRKNMGMHQFSHFRFTIMNTKCERMTTSTKSQ